MNIKKLMKQALQMQSQMEEKLGEITVEGSAGGGAVKIVLSGKRDLIDIHIEPEILNPDDSEMVADMIRAAFEDATRQADEEAASLMSGMMRLPI